MWNGISWSSPPQIGLADLTSISCATTSSCVALDDIGDSFTWNGASWSGTSGIEGIDTGFGFTSVSCPTTSYCVAVDNAGEVFTGDGSSWSFPADADGSTNLTSVSCPTVSFCAAVDRAGNALTATPVTPLPYTAVTPTRICDTRAVGPGVSANQCNAPGAGTLQAGDTATIDVPGLPVGATAAVLNVTVADTSAPSFLTIWPAGVPQPIASNLNWSPGQVVANLSEVTLGAGHQVNIFNAAGSADVIVDLEGYVAPIATAGTGLYNPLPPSRICDTRAVGSQIIANQCNHNGVGTGTLGTGGTLPVQVTGNGGVPASGVSAVVLNVTVTGTSAPSFLTAWPTGVSQPNASNLNWVAGTTRANRVIVPVSPSGQVSLYNASGSADVVVDVAGWFTDSSSPSATGADYEALSPSRICDTRAVGPGIAANQCNHNGVGTGTLGTDGTQIVQVTSNGGVPVGAVAVVANATVANTTAASFLTVWPDVTTRPNASDLNWFPDQVVPNLVVGKLGTDGAVDLYNPAGSTDAIVDVEGYYIG